ncbi:MAG: hypothetical protein V1874_17745 [Spirochaetota bacterium]
MQNRSGLALSPLVDDSDNVVSLSAARERKYNPQAAFYALPKAFINRLLFSMSGSTLKVFLALVYHTDCWNVIKYPGKITHSNLMKTTGIKKKETISNAYKELEELSIIGGYTPGHGADNTKFYFTFDINHYRTDECCLDQAEISSYYEMLLSGKFTNMPFSDPAGSDKETASNESIDLSGFPEESEPVGNVSQACSDDYDIPESSAASFSDENKSSCSSSSLNYAFTIASSWGTEIKLYHNENPDIFFLEDGSFFCDKDDFFKNYQHCVIKDTLTIQEPVQTITCELGIIPAGVPENGMPSPLETAQGSTEKKDSLKTINSYKINKLIVMAQKDFNFIHEFNNFCIDDSPKYLKNTLYWLIQHAVDFNLSLGDVIDSLNAANNKGKHGKMCYLVGVMRNKAGNNSRGLKVITKPEFVQAKEYFSERFGHCIEYLKSYSFDWTAGELRYTLKDPAKDRSYLAEFFKFVVEDIKKAVGVSLSHVEVA